MRALVCVCVCVCACVRAYVRVCVCVCVCVSESESVCGLGWAGGAVSVPHVQLFISVTEAVKRECIIAIRCWNVKLILILPIGFKSGQVLYKSQTPFWRPRSFFVL